MMDVVSMVAGALGWAVLHLTWQAALVAGLVGAAGRIADDAPPSVRHTIAFSGLLLLPVLFSGTALALIQAVSGSASAGAGAEAAAGSAAGALDPALELVALAGSFAPWLGLAWCLWGAASVARWLGGLWLLGRLATTRSRPAGSEWRPLLEEAVRRVGTRREVALRASSRVEGPLVVGIRRPVVLVPTALFEGLGSGDRLAVLVHELAHVRRGDYLRNAVQALLRSLFLFHPGVGWLSRGIDRERELACDELAARVLADRRRYAASLAKLELARVAPHRLAPAAYGSPLIDRLRRLADPPAAGLSGVATLRLAILGAAATTLLALGITACVSASAGALRHATAPVPAEYIITATDPAGQFTLSIRDGRPVAATVDGRDLPASRLVQRRAEITLVPDPPLRPFTVRLVPGGIRWEARTPTNS